MAQWPSLLGGRNKLVSWLNKFVEKSRSRELKQVIGNGRLIESSDGLTVEIWGSEKGPIIFFPVCKQDGSGRVFYGFRMADGKEYTEAMLPPGAKIFDPTPP